MTLLAAPPSPDSESSSKKWWWILISVPIVCMVVLMAPILVILSLTGEDTTCGQPTGTDIRADGSLVGLKPGSLAVPMAEGTYTISSPFGMREGEMHDGQDYAAPLDTPFYAAGDGEVVVAGPASGYGHWIRIRHTIDGQTVESLYGHMTAAGVLVKAGDKVTAGQLIGKVGSEGQSSGPHLHFGIYPGQWSMGGGVDPVPWLKQRGTASPAAASAPTQPDAELVAKSTPAGTGGLNASQTALAKQAVAIGESMGVPDQGIVVALATMSQESTYRMLASSNVPESLQYPHDGVGSDHLSVNQYQQQVGIWGTAEDLMNPVTANVKFFDALLKVSGWQSMPVTVAAQTVQGSAHPEAYADDETLARQLASQFKGSGKDLTPQELADIVKGGAATTIIDGGACAPGTSNPGGPQFKPGGPFGANVIAAASQWIGTTYAWGGGDQNGPTKGISDGGGAGDANGDSNKVGFDCSGLTLYAVYQASGGQILLPHFTGSHANPGQLYDTRGQDIPFDQKRPGDLIYFGAGGDTHHVGIFYGTENGQDMLLNAPESGKSVSIMPLSGWAGEEMYVKRFG